MNDFTRENTTLRRVTWRLIPLICLCYLLNIRDRGRVGFARQQMGAINRCATKGCATKGDMLLLESAGAADANGDGPTNQRPEPAEQVPAILVHGVTWAMPGH